MGLLLTALVLPTKMSFPAYLGSAAVRHLSWKGLDLMEEATRLRFWEGKLVGMRRLADSGVDGAQALGLPPSGATVSNLSVFAQDRYFRYLLREELVVAELLSLYRLGVTGSSFAWVEAQSEA